MTQTSGDRALALSVVLTALVLSPNSTTAELLAQASSLSGAQPQVAAAAKEKNAHRQELMKEARLDSIRRAQVWSPTNIPEMDLRAGPQGPGAFLPDDLVTCDYVPKKLPGTSLKFECAISEGDTVKVRYGANNPKVEADVVATRLLWALGFGADRVYPVRVACRGCSANPWTQRQPVPGQQVFDLAAIERKPQGHQMDSEHEGGWAWPELDLIEEAQGGAPLPQRDALKITKGSALEIPRKTDDV